MVEERGIDLQAYLERIGLSAAPPPDLTGLGALHVAHLDRIPFENIDVFLGRPGRLDVEALQAKLVRGGRGGYCFEQNGLFAAVLRALGFAVHTLEARVRPPGAASILPRTHMVLRVDLDGRPRLADVGFGGDGPLLPVPLDGEAVEQPHGTYRVGRERGDAHVLRRSVGGGAWQDLYAFTLAPAEPVDFLVAHHFTSTWPSSPFVRTLTVQRCRAEARDVLRGRSHTVQRDGREAVREIGDAELGPLLAGTFGLRLGEDVVREIAERLDALSSGAEGDSPPAPGT